MLGHKMFQGGEIEMPSVTTNVAGPTVLVLVSSYLPGYKAGGPIRSVANLAAALGNEVHFKIVTQDRDLGDKSPYAGVVANRWVRVGCADVMYLRPGLRGFLRMYALLRSVDPDTVLYLNSFFARGFSILAVLMRWFTLCLPRCMVLAPRGEFSPGALRFKHTRKRLYIRIAHWFGLYQGLMWHASTDFEAADISRQFSLAQDVLIAAVIPGSDAIDGKKRTTSEVAIASDLTGTLVPVQREGQPKIPGRLRAVFVSRVSRKKNLAGALRMLAGVSGDVVFDIYGPAEDAEYWEECQGVIAALPSSIVVRYRGEIAHERIAQVFAEHDLFLFPTLGENYGHVICEALASGCPVLISDQTPWRNLEAEGIGWDIPLGETERFRAALQQCVDGSGEWHAALSERAVEYAVNRASDPQTIEANRKLFQSALNWTK
jgi:glycosyltransferase involved in cell wall biosynthesis